MTDPRKNLEQAEQYASNALNIFARPSPNPDASRWHQRQALVHAALAIAGALLARHLDRAGGAE